MIKLKYIKLFESFKLESMGGPRTIVPFGDMTIPIMRISRDSSIFQHSNAVLYPISPGKGKGETVVSEDSVRTLYWLIEKNKIFSKLGLGPEYSGEDAVSLTIFFKNEEDKKKALDIIKEEYGEYYLIESLEKYYR